VIYEFDRKLNFSGRATFSTALENRGDNNHPGCLSTWGDSAELRTASALQAAYHGGYIGPPLFETLIGMQWCFDQNAYNTYVAANQTECQGSDICKWKDMERIPELYDPSVFNHHSYICVAADSPHLNNHDPGLDGVGDDSFCARVKVGSQAVAPEMTNMARNYFGEVKKFVENTLWARCCSGNLLPRTQDFDGPIIRGPLKPRCFLLRSPTALG
jgi:hypothetical protein